VLVLRQDATIFVKTPHGHISFTISSSCANKMDFKIYMISPAEHRISSHNDQEIRHNDPESESKAAEWGIELAPDEKGLRRWYTKQRVRPFQSLHISPYVIRQCQILVGAGLGR